MKYKKWSFLAVLIMVLISSCKKDELDFNKLSKNIELEHQIAFPLINGIFSFDSLFNEEYDSLGIINGDTIKFYFNLSFSNQDTIKIADTLSKDSKLTIEYANLYYWFTNEFPLGLDIKVQMYDSIHSSLVDSILFSTPGQIFLEPAPVDENGVVIRDQLEEKNGVIAIDRSQADNLMHNSTHLIVATEIQADNLSIVKITNKTYLYFQLSIDAMCIYRDTLKIGD